MVIEDRRDYPEHLCNLCTGRTYTIFCAVQTWRCVERDGSGAGVGAAGAGAGAAGAGVGGAGAG